jgi:hypothetical protein
MLKIPLSCDMAALSFTAVARALRVLAAYKYVFFRSDIIMHASMKCNILGLSVLLI